MRETRESERERERERRERAREREREREREVSRYVSRINARTVTDGARDSRRAKNDSDIQVGQMISNTDSDDSDK